MSKPASNLKPVLFVVTSCAVKGDTDIPTGYNLAEVTHPLEKLQEANITIAFASIKGGEAPLDGLEDMNDPIIARFWADAKFRHAIANTIPIEEVDPSEYSAIFFAGGHGTMWDFPDCKAVQDAIREIDASGGIISAVCHGPAAFINAPKADGTLFIAGKKLAAFTDDEEAEVLSTNIVPFLLASTLNARGAHHQHASNWANNVVVDGRLITGQNPQSAASVGEALRDALLMQHD